MRQRCDCRSKGAFGRTIDLYEPEWGKCQRVDYYKVDPTDELIIIYDDINLAPGKLRIREKGSAGGHNGIKNIIAHLGSQEFPRIRIGVGEKPKGWDLADYVLGRFAKEEEPVIREALEKVVQACEVMITEDTRTAMNRFNG